MGTDTLDIKNNFTKIKELKDLKQQKCLFSKVTGPNCTFCETNPLLHWLITFLMRKTSTKLFINWKMSLIIPKIKEKKMKNGT